MKEPLTQNEFDLWRESDTEFKRQILEHIKDQTRTNLAVESRLTELDTYRKQDVMRLGIFTSLISAAIAGLGVLFGRH